MRWMGVVAKALKRLVGMEESRPWAPSVNPAPAERRMSVRRVKRGHSGDRVLLKSGRRVTRHELKCLVIQGGNIEKMVA